MNLWLSFFAYVLVQMYIVSVTDKNEYVDRILWTHNKSNKIYRVSCSARNKLLHWKLQCIHMMSYNEMWQIYYIHKNLYDDFNSKRAMIYFPHFSPSLRWLSLLISRLDENIGSETLSISSFIISKVNKQ